tara:strand:- start:315 stop:785 length:471 start_codon:yes stop_codon:yes gene_type:complete
MTKIIEFNEIGNVVSKLKEENKKIVTTNGVFDILHVGHVRYLKKAKEMGDILIIGCNSDSSVKQIKGEKRPINNENDRAEVISALECVDYVVIFGENDPVKLLEQIKPNVHVKGGDYKVDDLIEREIVEVNGGEIVVVGLEEGYSTTSLIGKIGRN